MNSRRAKDRANSTASIWTRSPDIRVYEEEEEGEVTIERPINTHSQTLGQLEAVKNRKRVGKVNTRNHGNILQRNTDIDTLLLQNPPPIPLLNLIDHIENGDGQGGLLPL